jgi:hypothetical protein
MAATPKRIGFGTVRYFAAQFNGSCSTCGTGFSEGDQIGFNAENEIVAEDCCGGAIDFEPKLTSVDGSIQWDDHDGSINGKKPRIAVMPTGRTAKDRCNRCFLIHTRGQGDECQ